MSTFTAKFSKVYIWFTFKTRSHKKLPPPLAKAGRMCYNKSRTPPPHPDNRITNAPIVKWI